MQFRDPSNVVKLRNLVDSYFGAGLLFSFLAFVSLLNLRMKKVARHQIKYYSVSKFLNLTTFRDPRLLQIFLMLSLLGYGAFTKDFSLKLNQVILTFLAGIITQIFFIKRLKLKNIGLLSAIITCIGLSLLLRADNYLAHPIAAGLAVSAKFLIRVNNKHLFNPANLGVILGLTLFSGTWVSSGQWGSNISTMFWVLALGSIGIHRVRSNNLTWSFLVTYLGIWLVHRVFYLGYELDVFVHQLQNGAFLLFAFFMISDPKTTPNHNKARLIYTALVASLAYVIQYYFYYQNALLWGLLILSPTVPVLDKLFIRNPFEWKKKEEKNEEETSILLPNSIPALSNY